MRTKFLFLVPIVALTLFFALAITPRALGQDIYPEATASTFEKLLEPGSVLTDGPKGTKWEIKEYTWFTWVDLWPGAKFEHDTAYIFVTAGGKVTVEAGKWWPELDGKIILYGWEPWKVKFPVDVHGKTGTVKVYAHPELITPKDKLSDGGKTPIKIPANTLLYWVDLKPGYRFAHPTMYILVSANDEVTLVKGEWWPVLNGKKILYNEPPTVLKFPYPVD